MSGAGGGAVAVTNRDICTDCGACVSGCLAKAREIAGHLMTAEAALETVKRDTIFYNASGGGMTLSGGEPLAHPDFAESLLTGRRRPGSTPRSRAAAMPSGRSLTAYFHMWIWRCWISSTWTARCIGV